MTSPERACEPVALVDLAAQHRLLLDEIRAAFERVLASGVFVLGPEVAALEREMADLLGAGHAVGCASGTDAQLCAMMALGIGPGDEVVTTPFTFFATAGCIARLGAKPVFVDLDPRTLCIDPARVAEAVGPRTRAIVPVHLYGQPCAMPELVAVAQDAGVPILEDAAQSVMAETSIGMTGTIGLVGWLSFYPTKNLGALGDAGMALTNDADLAERMRSVRNHGSPVRYHHEVIGGNFRLDAIQAAALRVKLPRLARWTQIRRERAALYDRLFRQAAIDPERFQPLERVEEGHVYHQYVIRSPERDALRNHLAERRIGSEVYYPVPLHLQPCFADLDLGVGSLPVAERAAREVLALPIHPELTDAQVERVVGAVAEFFR